MTALYAIATPYPFVDDQLAIGIVADDTQAHYVLPANAVTDSGLDDSRIHDVAVSVGTRPTNAQEWFEVASYNIGYFQVDDPTEVESIDQATRAAEAQLAQYNSTVDLDQATGNDPWSPTFTTREDRVAFQQKALDQWAQQYPEAADGADDPDANLALKQLTTPPIQPASPHDWLPLTLGDTDCAFCGQPQAAAIHSASADTVARGSE